MTPEKLDEIRRRVECWGDEDGAALLAEVERLTAERDEARRLLDEANARADAAETMLTAVRAAVRGMTKEHQQRLGALLRKR